MAQKMAHFRASGGGAGWTHGSGADSVSSAFAASYTRGHRRRPPSGRRLRIAGSRCGRGQLSITGTHSPAGQDEGVSWSDAELDDRIEEIIVDAYGDYEQLASFACVLDELLDVPVSATAMGEAVQLMAIEDGGSRLGLRATVKRPTGTWTVALVDITVDPVSHPEVAMTVAAYRRWLGDGVA